VTVKRIENCGAAACELGPACRDHIDTLAELQVGGFIMQLKDLFHSQIVQIYSLFAAKISTIYRIRLSGIYES